VTADVNANTKFPNPTTSGLFQVASDETKTSITIRATSTADGSKSGTATVTVPNYTVNSVSISPSGLVSVTTNSTQTFTATVNGTYSPPQTVTWTIEGNDYTETKISTSGVLTVHTNETATTFTVRATSTADSSKSGEATVYDPHSLKRKFGITTTGTAGVTDTFNALSQYIKGNEFGGANSIIELGDHIDLEAGLTLGTSRTITNKPYLRLIVVGINSFHSGKGVNGAYTVTANDATPHVVFHFKNIPYSNWMSGASNNFYITSSARTYMIGTTLTSLINAGVPEEVLWAPTRYIANAGSGATGRDTITDLLWLPTEREMFGSNTRSSSTYETAANQARLEYYSSDAMRKKSGDNDGYWMASPASSTTYYYCYVTSSGGTAQNSASVNRGIVPAFCVK
jgi:hypothetical protein